MLELEKAIQNQRIRTDGSHHGVIINHQGSHELETGKQSRAIADIHILMNSQSGFLHDFVDIDPTRRPIRSENLVCYVCDEQHTELVVCMPFIDYE